MAKLNDAPIAKADVAEYLNDYSDFAFELKVLKKLSDLGFNCSHSGVYEDPITKKTREFDIRAEKSLGNKTIKLAVECKNFRANFPLVAHCVKRPNHESFHDLIITNQKHQSGNFTYLIGTNSSSRIRLCGTDSLYPESGIVAKSVDQVGRGANGIISNDGSVFEKINQAIHSAYDLIEQAHYDKAEFEKKTNLILPLLVIPDRRLWYIEYDENGTQLGDPEIIETIPHFVGQSWRVGHVGEKFSDFVWYKISHLEIVSYSHLEAFLNNYFNPTDEWEKAFTDKEINELLEEEEYKVG